MTAYRRLPTAAAVLAVVISLFLLACGSTASSLTGELRVSTIHASPAGRGGFSRLSFSLDNAGIDHVVVRGIELPGDDPSRIVGSLGGVLAGTLGPLLLAAGETIDFDGERLWIEVGPLSAEFAPGASLDGWLVVGSIRVPVAIIIAPPSVDVTGPMAVSAGRGTLSTSSIARPGTWRCLPG